MKDLNNTGGGRIIYREGIMLPFAWLTMPKISKYKMEFILNTLVYRPENIPS